MTPLLSWALLITLGLLGAAFALAVARYLEAADMRAWQRDIDDWHAMCREMELYDWEEQER